MNQYLYILLLPSACAMTISDFKYRHVKVWWLVLFGVTCSAAAVTQSDWREAMANAGGNIMILMVMVVTVWCYIAVRYRKKKKGLSAFIGSGDAIFLILLTPLFDSREFLWFLIVSFCVTLLGWVVYGAVTRRTTTIPLVATLCISLVGYLVIKIL